MKISKLYIRSFRGIPNECTLNFCDKRGKAKSVIIYGGNGSGKSSIVDAIEFNLQGRIEREIDFRNPKRPSTLNLLSKDFISAYTTIDFDDNTSNERNIIVENDEINNHLRFLLSSNELHEGFKEVSIALRRNEIISYNYQEEKLRQFFISSFIYSDFVEELYSKHEEITKLKNKIKNNFEERRTLAKKLSQKIKFPIEDILNNREGAENFVRRNYSPKGTDFQSLKHSFKRDNGIVNKPCIDGKIFDEYIKLARKIDEISDKGEKLKKQKTKIIDLYRQTYLSEYLNEEYFPKAEIFLTDAFKNISNVNYVDEIRLSRGEKSNNSLSIKILLNNGKVVSPTDIFSEANYDLMILLLYLSIIRVGVDSKNQAKVLLIDDVLQSIDASIRTKFISYIFQELKDWQFIITCHDRLWLNQLKHLFKCHNVGGFKEFHITNWSFETGPVISEIGGGVDNSIQQALSTNNVKIIAATAGSFLEKICNEITMNMGFSIERRIDDKYELNDLWNAVKSKLKKDDILNPICNEIEQVYYLRNTFGAHYNKWAESINEEEVIRFANNVQHLYEKSFCPNCHSWIKKQKDKKEGKCSCGDLTVKI